MTWHILLYCILVWLTENVTWWKEEKTRVPGETLFRRPQDLEKWTVTVEKWNFVNWSLCKPFHKSSQIDLCIVSLCLWSVNQTWQYTKLFHWFGSSGWRWVFATGICRDEPYQRGVAGHQTFTTAWVRVVQVLSFVFFNGRPPWKKLRILSYQGAFCLFVGCLLNVPATG